MLPHVAESMTQTHELIIFPLLPMYIPDSYILKQLIEKQREVTMHAKCAAIQHAHKRNTKTKDEITTHLQPCHH